MWLREDDERVGGRAVDEAFESAVISSIFADALS